MKHKQKSIRCNCIWEKAGNSEMDISKPQHIKSELSAWLETTKDKLDSKV